MPNIAVNDVIEVTLGYIAQAQQCLMVRHYVCANLPADLDYEGWLDQIMNEWLLGAAPVVGGLARCMHSAVSINFIQAQGIFPTRLFYKRLDQAIPGSNGGIEPMPPNSAITLSLQTDRPGRGRTGSVHVGGLSSTCYTDDGFVEATYKGLVQVLGNRLKNGIGGVSPNNYWKACTFNRLQVPHTNLIRAASVRDTMRVQRRRTVGLGI